MNRSLRHGFRRMCLVGLLLLLLTGCRSGLVPSPPDPTGALSAVVTQAPSPTPGGTLVLNPAVPEPSPAVPEPVLTAPPTAPATPLPTWAGGAATGLAGLEQVDSYPLYVMHLHGDIDILAELPEAVPAPAPAWGCSLFATLSDGGARLYGRNFDWEYSPALLLFVYPDDGYSSVTMVNLGLVLGGDLAASLVEAPLGARRPLLYMPSLPMDGMNEYGLAVGMAAVPDAALPYDAALPSINSLTIMREMLDHARDVEEALAVMRSYNISMAGGPHLHYLLADAGGHAVLVETYEGEMRVLPNEQPWHLATNHIRSDPGEAVPGRCWRYDRLEQTLISHDGFLQVTEAMALLAAVKQSNTQWSVVYDMTAREVHVVMGRDYDTVHTFGLVTGNLE